MASEGHPDQQKPTVRGVQPPPKAQQGVNYNVLQDKVGLVPNIRRKDNTYQGLIVLALALVGALFGAIKAPIDEPRNAALAMWTGAGIGAVAGLVGGGVLTGFVLMVVGLRRKS